MKPFLDTDFLLHSKTAQRLFHEFAAGLPIIDYHCHLNPADIAADRRFDNITQVWLQGDHYKWRAMRTNGISEHYCTGTASDQEKFLKWAETVPRTLRNPLYHWTHLELQRYFGIHKLLSPDTAEEVYLSTQDKLQSAGYSVRGLIERMKVEVICTTDDPADSLGHHHAIASAGWGVKVLPTWRPDKAMAADSPVAYGQYLDQLSKAAGIEISTYDQLLEALTIRHQYFGSMGCRISDHGLERFYSADFSLSEVRKTFETIRKGKAQGLEETDKLKSALLYELALMDCRAGWVQQFHVGAMRNNNTRLFQSLGPDTGFDSIGDYQQGVAMSRFLDRLDATNQLAKTILYNLNPADNELLATMAGNFQDGTVAGKIQFGSGWWFLDQKDGMERQLNALSNLGLLSRFVGMLTDSRSFLSYPRHEYFRRILCNLIGGEAERGELPADISLLGQLVEDVSYFNAKNWFSFPD